MIQGTPKQGNTIIGEVCGVTKDENYRIAYSDGYGDGYKEGEYLGRQEGAEENYNSGYNSGYENGYESGHSTGYTNGLNEGHAEGVTEGYNNGYTQGLNEGHAEGYSDGYNVGHADGYNEAKAEEETFFTLRGAMYKKNMLITAEGKEGFSAYAYWKAYQMETVEVPNLRAANGAQGYVFQDCTALKTASLPKIQNIGVRTFYNCTALEELTLGCEEYPMAAFGNNALQNCSALVRLNLVGAIETSHSYSSSPLLDEVSIRNIVNSLADLTGKTMQTVTLHANAEKWLTGDVTEIASNKNWSIAIV